MKTDTKNRRKNSRELGTEYEKLAGKYLQEQGYRILQYNFRSPKGEIDIIAKDGEYLVFCEVKYRESSDMTVPLSAVDEKKQRKISAAASWYLMKHGFPDMPCRFDVAGVTEKGIMLVKNAFDYRG